MNTADQKDWQLFAIHRLAGRGREKSFGNKDISDELTKIPSLSDDEARAIIRSAGFRRTDLEEDRLLRRTVKPGRVRGNSWGLTSAGRKRVFAFLKENPELDVYGDKRSAETLAAAFGVDAQAIRLLKNYKVSAADLGRLLQSWEENQNRLIVDLLSEKDAQNEKTNLAVERKAIKFIRAKEPGWHRTPPSNPGFDLYQTDNNRKTGTPTLWCEVKSFSGAFNSAELTPTEFRAAQERKTDYWLYIVENVESDAPNLFKIQDPASKPFRFRIDASWKRFATE